MSQMRIALVSVNKIGCEPTALLYLASWLNAKTKHQFSILDANYCPDLLSVILRGGFDAIGITAMTCDYEAATRLASQIKERRPSLQVILGGIHISCLPESKRPVFDAVVIGEGEIGLPKLLGETVEPLCMDTYPPLNRKLLNRFYWERRFQPGLASYERTSILMGSRGCPYKCIFCASPTHWHGYRKFPVEWMIRELQDMASRGITHVTIFDDVFTLQKSRLKAFCEAKEAAGLNTLKLSVNSRANLLDAEACDLLRSANCQSVMFGWESGNQRILTRLKGQAVEVGHNLRSIRLCRSRGLMAVGGVIFGEPTETKREAWDSVKFIWRAWLAGAFSLAAYKLVPLPGTPVWKEAEERGEVSANMDFDRLGFDIGAGLPRWIRWAIWFPIQAMKLRKIGRFIARKCKLNLLVKQ